MALILVDYENVCGCDGLKGTRFLRADDCLILFYSECCSKAAAEHMKAIEESGCQFQIHKLIRTCRNGLDFYIAAECGVQYERGARQIAIVSRDKGFGAVVDYFREKKEDKLQIVRAENIEHALMKLDAPGDEERRRLIRANTEMLEIESAYIRIQERAGCRERLYEIFGGTEYEVLIDRIMKYVSEKGSCTPRQMYTGTLHEFGRRDGTRIYRMIKPISSDICPD